MTDRIQLHVGIDDTDSRLGGCTTYTGARIFQNLIKMGLEPSDFPWLVRLNPNIPWKTRGNGAVALHFEVAQGIVSEVKELVISTVVKDCDLSQRSTDPAIVFLEGPASDRLRDFAGRALNQVLTVDEARRLCDIHGVDVHVMKGSRGIIGALAAVGARLENENTFEIIAYRTRSFYGTPREISPDSIRRMDAKFHRSTFSNRDPETQRILITPHGPDPVLFGIRGEDPFSLAKAAEMLDVEEPIETMSVFRTNAGTDAHLTRTANIGELERYDSVILKGTVETIPRTIRGGHVFFALSDHSGSITCAAFQPVGHFRNVVSKLVPGDLVRAFGGVHFTVKHGLALNLEKLEVLELAESFDWVNPYCADCGARCESMGTNQGYRCRKCRARYPKAARIPVVRDRLVRPGVYLPPARAHRHLTRPADRMSKNWVGSWTDWEKSAYSMLGGGGAFRTLIARTSRNTATPKIARRTTADTTVCVPGAVPMDTWTT